MEPQRIARLLPELYQASLTPGSVLDAALAVMAEQHRPVEAVLDGLDTYFDPRRAPDPFVRMLAGWVGLDWLVDAPAEVAADRRGRIALGEANLRELVARAAELARLRGTAGALRIFLELATGLEGFEVVEAPPGPDGRPLPFAAELRAPAAALPFADLIAAVVAQEKPAFTTITITYASR